MLMADWEIKAACLADAPFIENALMETTSTTPLGARVPSWGLSSYGYDVRLGPDVRVMSPSGSLYNPLSPDEDAWQAMRLFHDGAGRQYAILPARAVMLGATVERFNLPNGVTGVVTGKSTYARCGVQCLVTPLESGWSGHVTLELVNHSPRPVAIFIGAGIAQVQFLKGRKCLAPYGVRSGKYQDQPAEVVLSR